MEDGDPVISLEDVRESLLALSATQQIAIDALATGSTQAAAAEGTGVSRETVTRWAGHHPAVRAAFGAYRAALIAEQVDTVRAIRGRAPAILAENLGEVVDLVSALAVLRAIPCADAGSWRAVPLTADMLLDDERAVSPYQWRVRSTVALVSA